LPFDLDEFFCQSKAISANVCEWDVTGIKRLFSEDLYETGQEMSLVRVAFIVGYKLFDN